MAATKYFTLTNSNATLSKKFRVLHSGYSPTLEKAQTVRKTLTGGFDISSGGVRERHDYMVRVSEADPEAASGYGSKADLETFFRYNNPNGTPSNRITLTDHFGDDFIVVMNGDFSPQIMGIMVEGNTSYYLVRCSFLFLQAAP